MNTYWTLKKHTPRWFILIIDLVISVFSIVFAYLLRFNFDLKNPFFDNIHLIIIYIFFVRLIFFLITKSYAGIIRYTGTKDMIRIFLVITYTNSVFAGVNYFMYFFINGEYIIPFSAILIDYFVAIFLLTGFRLFVKTVILKRVMYSEK
jgi:FlaA1/EpsC-like NDP-sugar epimerase